MKTIEFETVIRDGIIKLPSKYRNLANKFAKIILLTDEDKEIKGKAKQIRYLIKQITAKKVFTDIENPSKWQKEVRNEWE